MEGEEKEENEEDDRCSEDLAHSHARWRRRARA
jgi:hypothetical protein